MGYETCLPRASYSLELKEDEVEFLRDGMQIFQSNLNKLNQILDDKVFMGEQNLEGYWINTDEHQHMSGDLAKFFEIQQDDIVPLLFASFDL